MDRNFETEIKLDFYARFWEMYLTCALLKGAPQHGYSIPDRKQRGYNNHGGPDILLKHNDRRIWIEAVAAKNGDPTKADSLMEPGEHDSEDYEPPKIPVDKIILRYTNAINEKFEKYRKYLLKNVVHKCDSYVIAVNGFPLFYRWTGDPSRPRILQAVFPIDVPEYVWNKKTPEDDEIRYQTRPEIFKNSGAPVSTAFFVDDKHHGVSAVLYSNANAFSPGLDKNFIVVVHNPLASQPVPRGLIPAAQEWWAEEVSDGYRLVHQDR
ncbi:MAG: hypothetical protein HQK59_02250 [Deltaproteobacteria bacterium]|nr:hypothetical protein [Deltaproteobacteria bacterium]